MKTTITVLTFLLLTSAASAQKTLKYLSPAEIDPSRLLPPPPKDGSDFQKKEMADLKGLLAARTPERFKQAQWDDEHESSIAFASTIGPAFDLAKLPITAKLLAAVENDQSVAASAAKVYFARRFAAVIDTSLVPLNCDPAGVQAAAAKPGGRALRSYPSGHATMGYSVGVFLAALIPEKSQAIMARAADYSLSREVCGEHYHSDVEASHALGNAVGIMLLNNAALKPQIEAAKAELKAAHIITPAADYKLLTSYPVPGTGTFDYITIDSAARRLYLSHQTRVDVIDADNGKILGAITDTPGVHGAAIVSKFNHGFTTNGDEAKVSMFDTRTLKTIKKIAVGPDVDSFVYDADSGRVLVSSHGSNEITAIDPAKGEVLGAINVGGAAEQMVSGGNGLMYANIEQLGEVLVFDPKTLQAKSHFPAPGCTQPSGLAADTKYHRLFIGCRSKILVVMDATNGKIITTMPIGSRNDDAWFDPQGRLIFASTGEGKLNIFHQKSADEYEDASTVTTEPNAKTSAFDAKTGKVYLLTGEIESIPAADPSQKPTRKVKEGTYKVLVVGK